MRRCIRNGLLVLWCASLSLSAQTIAEVPSQYATITAALALGAPVVRVAAGIYNESIAVGNVHLIGAGAASTTINGGPSWTVEATASSSMRPVIQGFTITGSGHGVAVWGSGFMTLVDCVIVGASAPVFSGSAVFMQDEEYPDVDMVRCRIHGCSGPTAVSAGSGTLRMIGCTVDGNSGSGISGPFYGGLHVVDCLVVNNGGVGISLIYGSAVNCTLAGNGGGVSCVFYNQITNSILWGNGGNEISAFPGMSPQVNWCDIQGGYPGTSNISSDPLFTDPLNGDYSLGTVSPCIDTGDPGAIDPDGSRSDIGYRPDLPLLPGFAVNFPVLIVNGSIGSVARRVDVPVMQPVTLYADWYASIPESFMILGFLGVPSFTDQVVFQSLGGLAFPPALPGLGASSSFTLTNNLFPDPLALIPSTSAPWSVTFPAGLPAPIQITLQSVTLVTPGWLAVSNAILLNVY